MIAKTAEGLLGANNAMNVIRTPMKVFKEARARGDTATMERAMGYVEKSHDEAWEKKYSADEGLKQEAKENELKNRQDREELAQRIREKCDELENRAEESDNGLETVISEGGTDDPEKEGDPIADAVNASVNAKAAESTQTDPVTYTRSGEVKVVEVKTEFSVTA